MARTRCRHPQGITIKPDGIHPLDPCVYKEKELHLKVDLHISQCVHCGHITFEWYSTDETEHIYYEPLDEEPEDD